MSDPAANARPHAGAPIAQPPPKLGIIAGAGAVPVAVARAAIAGGRAVHVLGFHGDADPALSAHPMTTIRWGQVGRIFRTLRREGCEDVVLVGAIRRPKILSLRPDLGLFANLPAILRLTRGGDDSVLTRVVKLFEAKGFRIVGAHQIAPELVAPEGPLGSIAPAEQDLQDIALGLKVVDALGALDVGQAAVVARGYVLAVEAAEGTDEMLRRCAKLRQWGFRRGGVLVKCPKPGQELRIDMPAIGPNTIELAAAAGLNGLAVASGQVLLADPDALVRKAEAAGLFVTGVGREAAPSGS